MLSALDRQIFTAWTQRTFRRETRSPRIAIVGNCQALGVAYGVKLLLPRGAVDIYQVQPGTLTSIKSLAATLTNYEHVFCSDFPSGFVRGGNSDALQEFVGTIIRFPLVTFAGFHPDIIGINKTPDGSRIVFGPMGPYHSAIVLFAFRAGFSVDEAEALFDRAVFNILGYFDMWEPACAGFLAHAKATGTDLSGDIVRWTRRGCFMHTVNHPKAYVLFDIARSMLARVGISTADLNFDDYAFDPLASNYVCPVYEPIAESLGIKGSYLFKQNRGIRRRGGFLLLRQFIEESYRTYGRLQRTQLENTRVSGVLDHADTVRMLREFASAKINRRGTG
jgi:Polysaccharide biosynthesis enzyme WcbI